LDVNGEITRTDLQSRNAKDGLGYYMARRRKGDENIFLLDYATPGNILEVIRKHYPKFVRATSPSTGFLASKPRHNSWSDPLMLVLVL
jgi:hypothetical protein